MQTSPRLPTGTVTFLFTDIEGSTALWGRAPQSMSEALAAHDALFRAVVPAHDGVIFKTVGDAICAAFPRADRAIEAAIEAQRRLATQTWPAETGPIRVRMGLHTGQAIERDNDYFGPALNRVARIMGIAHGGQVLVTRATASVVEGMLDASIRMRDLGVHHLKGLAEPEAAYQIVAPGLEVEFPPLASGDQHPNNLPAPISTFVGRTRELAELAELTQFHRLVTIAGPGGIGKTRTERELAAALLGRFPDGAWIVELAPVNDPRLVVQTIGDAFHLREDPQSTIDAQLLEFLGPKKLLLVLDNAEHVLAETAELAKQLLTHCPELVIVTSSREPLHVTGEHVFRLPPLSLASAAGARNEHTSESLELFIERALAVRPDLPLLAGDRAIAERICATLEGIPLAIELAAARTVTLPLPDLERRLVQRFDLLTSRDATRDERHRTLYATIDWSYQLLADSERSYLRCLAVFDGGFTLAAASAVASVSETAALDATESLVDKSLVSIQPSTASGRYALADSVREFLRRDLAERGEVANACNNHFDYFAHYVQGAADHSVSAREEWIARLTADIANIRLAIDWGQAERPDDVATMLVDLCSYWQSRGFVSEAESQLRAFLARPERTDAQRAPLLRRAATFATIRGAYADAHALTQQSRTAYERIGDGGGIAEAIHNLAVIEHRTGDDAGAKRHYAEALALFRGSGNVRFELFSLLNLVLLALKADDFTTAADRLAEAGPLAEKIDDAGMRSYQIGLCGTLAFRRGRFDEAIELFGQALAIKRRLGERFDIAELLDRIAEATLKRGDGDAARALSRESLQIALELDSHVLLIRSFETFAELALHDAEPGEARLYFEHARALREQHGYKHTIRDLDALAAEIALANNGHRAQSYPPPSWRETAERLAFTPAPP